jgi:hypothetical protein
MRTNGEEIDASKEQKNKWILTFLWYFLQKVTPQLTVVPAPSLDEAFERM